MQRSTSLETEYHNTYVWSFLKLMIMIEHIKMMQIPYLDIWSMLLSRQVPHERVIPCQVIQAWTWPISGFDKNIRSCYNIQDIFILQHVFTFFNGYWPKTQLIKIHNSLDSSRLYGRLFENKKRGGSRESFFTENDLQTSCTVNFPKRFQILEAWKPTKDMKIRLEFFFT